MRSPQVAASLSLSPPLELWSGQCDGNDHLTLPASLCSSLPHPSFVPIHYSFSVVDSHRLYALCKRDAARTLLVINVITGQIDELQFSSIQQSSSRSKNVIRLQDADIFNFEELSHNVGVINYRKHDNNLGAAICELDFSALQIQAFTIDVDEDDELLHSLTPCRFAIHRASNVNYVFDDPPFSRRIHALKTTTTTTKRDEDDDRRHASIERTIALRYDLRQRQTSIETPFNALDETGERHVDVGELLCLNNGFDLTCAEMSVYLVNLRTGLVQNFATRLAADKFPLKCSNRLVENMQTACCNNGAGMIAMLSYESREDGDLPLYAFAHLDIATLQWTDLRRRVSASNASFQLVEDNTLMVAISDTSASGTPLLRGIYKLRFGFPESLLYLCYKTLLQRYPTIRTMSSVERRRFGLPLSFRGHE